MKRNNVFNEVLMLILLGTGTVYATTLTHTVCESGCDGNSLGNLVNHLTSTHYNLVGDDNNLLVSIVNSWAAPDTSSVTIGTTFVTDSTHGITIQTVGNARHDGTAYKTGAYTHRGTINYESSNITFNGLVVDVYGDNHAFYTSTRYISNVVIDSCILFGSTYGDNPYAVVAPRGGVVSVRNSIIYGFYDLAHERGGVMLDIYDQAPLSEIVNCTLYNNWGIGAASALVKNTIGIGYSTNNPFGSQHTNSDYNISSTTSVPGIHSLTEITAASLFTSTTDGSEDLHLKLGASAINIGNQLDSIYSIDIDGTTRPSGIAWDIGADEYAVSAGTIKRSFLGKGIYNRVLFK